MSAPVVPVRNVDLMGWHPDDRPASYWDDQAEMAIEHAGQRPASDLKGFLRSMRDARGFRELAALARVGGAQ